MNSSGTVVAAIDGNDVYLGSWTNWSRGRVLGATLTTTSRDGALLIAFLALYVSFAGTQFWRLTCFILHYRLSSSDPQDAVYHQRQVVLRNSPTGLAGILKFGQVLWAWRNYAQGLYRRLVPMLLASLLCFLAFFLAGIFSSQITAAPGDHVLLTGANCGILFANLDTDLDRVSTLLQPYLREVGVASQEYAVRCYSNISNSIGCDDFVKSRLPVTLVANAPCPFHASICQSQDKNMLIDSGYLDSQAHFGLNAPPEHRFLFRQVSHCAPLKLDGYAKLDNTSNPAHPVMRYYYGALNNFPPDYGGFSYEQPVADLHNTLESYGASQADYSIGTLQSWTRNEDARSFSQFQPIAQLDRDDAEISLFFLSANNIRFVRPVDDPWFSAHRGAGNFTSTSLGGSVQFYLADAPATVMGCATQEQWCRPGDGDGEPVCEPLNDGFDHGDVVTALWSDDEKMQAIMAWAYDSYALNARSIRTVVRDLGITSLTTRFSLRNGVQGPLAPDQWQAEVRGWFETSLANLQRLFVDVATGPSDDRLDGWLLRPQSPEERQACRGQIVRRAGYTSFSVLGLALVLALGGLIILAEFTLEPSIRWFQRHSTRVNYRRLEWVINDTLQLQRVAHEELGLGGPWMGTTDSVPFTKPGELLGVLDVHDPSHPMLMRGVTPA
ncbi:hypothetical protein F5Y17DRAFT_65954 [Xylariaceae sp. FL0594]|nr:hypothetical protein F5Y17DRAFT_65954 [Xylariaceae sp. FL0594]